MNNPIRIVLAVTTLAAVAACTQEPGTPVPSDKTSATTSPGGSSTSKENTSGAPRVKDPIDAAGFTKKPCGLLTADQTTALKLEKEGLEEQSAGDVYCSWSSADNRVDYTVGFLPDNKNGLADNYRANENGDWAYFDPTTVSGYPAVWQDATDGRDRGYCTIVTGVRDDLTFRVTVGGGAGRQGCDKVKEIAGQVIVTLKAGA